MYDIYYSKQANEDLYLLKRNPKMYKRYLEKENKISENPKKPDVPQGDFSELKGNQRGIYHMRLNQKHRIFYKIDESTHSIYIDKIEVEGSVKILQILGHDLK